jgi:ribosomal protein S18 acetylase RimI-like enzyme
MRVRLAQPADLGTLLGFIAEEAREAGEPVTSLATLERGIATALDDPSVAMYWLLLDDSDVPCGCISIVREWSDWNALDYWWIQSVYIVPERRGQGHLDLMLERVAESAREQGCRELRLYVHENNRRAIRAYEKAGFVHLPYRSMTCPIGE